MKQTAPGTMGPGGECIQVFFFLAEVLPSGRIYPADSSAHLVSVGPTSS